LQRLGTDRGAEIDPGALEQLRVCVSQPANGLNCGWCFKCLRTRLELRALGYGKPTAAFPEELDFAQVKLARLASLCEIEEVREQRRESALTAPVVALDAAQEGAREVVEERTTIRIDAGPGVGE